MWPPELADELDETEDPWLWELLHEIADATGVALTKNPQGSGCYDIRFSNGH